MARAHGKEARVAASTTTEVADAEATLIRAAAPPAAPRPRHPTPARRTRPRPAMPRAPSAAHPGPRTAARRARPSARRKAPRSMATSVCARSSALTTALAGSRSGATASCSARRRSGSLASAPPRQTWRISSSTTRRFGRPAAGALASAQAQQRQRVEGVLRRRGHLDAQAVRGPGDLAEGPRALGFDLGRALLAPMPQQAGEQHRPVVDHIGAAFQRLRQVLEGQVGIGRDRVEPEGQRFHREDSFALGRPTHTPHGAVRTAARRTFVGFVHRGPAGDLRQRALAALAQAAGRVHAAHVDARAGHGRLVRS